MDIHQAMDMVMLINVKSVVIVPHAAVTVRRISSVRLSRYF